jgi:hypothetical protein
LGSSGRRELLLLEATKLPDEDVCCSNPRCQNGNPELGAAAYLCPRCPPGLCSWVPSCDKAPALVGPLANQHCRDEGDGQGCAKVSMLRQTVGLSPYTSIRSLPSLQIAPLIQFTWYVRCATREMSVNMWHVPRRIARDMLVP